MTHKKIAHFIFFFHCVAEEYGKHSQIKKQYLYFPINTYVGGS